MPILRKKKSEKNQFSFILFQLCQTSCLNVSRKQSLSVNWNLPRTKVTLLIWRIIISVIIIKVETNFSLTATNKINFHANWRAIKAMNKKESWIIDYKYFNCESMTLCLQRKTNIRKPICNKKTKELHLDKIKRLILVWLFYGRPSLRLLLLTSFWESCLSWQTKTFVEAFLKLESVSKYLNKRQKKKKRLLYSLCIASSYEKERFLPFRPCLGRSCYPEQCCCGRVWMPVKMYGK